MKSQTPSTKFKGFRCQVSGVRFRVSGRMEVTVFSVQISASMFLFPDTWHPTPETLVIVIWNFYSSNTPDSFRKIIKEGDAERLAGMMVADGDLYSGSLEWHLKQFKGSGSARHWSNRSEIRQVSFGKPQRARRAQRDNYSMLLIGR